MLAEVLKEKRIKAGLSQGDVAKAMGYTSPQFISNWELSKSNPPATSIKKLAKIYNTDFNELKKIYVKSAIAELEADLEKKFSKGA